MWHLCEHYRITGDEKYLDAAIHLNREGGLPRQLPNGAWAGHNAWIFYHSLIVRGVASLYGVLPADHDAWAALSEPTIMALNHIIEEQRENGHFRACFDPEEWAASRNPESAYSIHRAEIFDAPMVHALVCIQDSTDLDVSNTLYGALGSPLPDDLDGQGWMLLSYGVGYRWLAEQAGQ